MNIKTSSENIGINRIILKKEESFMVESDEIVPDIKPDVLNIISNNGTVCIYKKDIQNGKAKIDGAINIYSLYVADDQMASVRGINSCLNFTKSIDIDDIKEDMQLECQIYIKTINSRILNGRKINFQITLGINLSIYSNESIEIIDNIEDVNDIQKLNKIYNINSLIGKGTTNTYAKETIKIDKDDNVLEIVKVKTKITNQEIKISYNKVLAKANFEVKIVFLTDDNRVSSVSATVPITGFIDIQNINENNICDIAYQLKNLNIKPNNVEEHSINMDAEIEINCFAYNNRDIEIIQDMYSPTRELKYNQSNIKILKNKRNLKQVCNIRSQEKIVEIGKNKIYDVEVVPTILRKDIVEGRISYDGELSLNFLFANGDERGINCKSITKPFNFNVADDCIKNDTKVETSISILNQDFIVMPDESIDTRIDLEFNLKILNMEDINIINEISEMNERNNEKYSIVIYYTKIGDTLWNIAKRFGSTVEMISSTNDIEIDKKIMPGEQLFIPRFI